jgi:hypothetical protein
MYPMPNNANPQIKPEANPPPPPPLLQIREPPQQIDSFPTNGTILTIIGGSNTDFDTKRQQSDYYRQVNHVVVEGPVTQTKWFHIPITFLVQDINLASFPHTDAMVSPFTSIDETSSKSSLTMVVKPKSFSS